MKAQENSSNEGAALPKKYSSSDTSDVKKNGNPAKHEPTAKITVNQQSTEEIKMEIFSSDIPSSPPIAKKPEKKVSIPN